MVAPSRALCRAWEAKSSSQPFSTGRRGSSPGMSSSLMSRASRKSSLQTWRAFSARAVQTERTLQNWHHSPGTWSPVPAKAASAAGFRETVRQAVSSPTIMPHSDRLSMRGWTMVIRTRLMS